MNQINTFYTKYIKRWVKALASAVGGAIAGLLYNLINGETAWPTTQKEWLTLLAATVLPAVFALFAPTNKITQKQLDNDPNVIGGVVVPDGAHADHVTVNPVTGETGEIPRAGQYPSSWT